MNIKETIRAEIERRKIAYRSSDNLQDAIRYDEITDLLAFLDTLPEQPVEGLEDEAINYCFDKGINLSPRQAADFARHFAEWGAEHLRDATKMIPEGLEEAAEKYRRESCNAVLKPNVDGPTLEYGGSIKAAFIAGAEWGEKQVKSND